MNTIRITSEKANARSVKATVDGKVINGIKRIEILPIVPGGPVMARLTCLVDVDLEAGVDRVERAQ